MVDVSVITPVYNCENFIKDSISSILAQSFTNFELIVINDGSSDKTAECVESFKDSRIRFVNHSENRGVMARSKEAIELATGKYIAIHDADDISMSNRLDVQYRYLESNANIFCVGGRAKKIAADGSFIGDWDFPPLEHKDIVTMLIISFKCPIINPTAMYRLADYKSLGGYSPDGTIKFAHDLDFWCKAILNSKKFANLQEYLIKYRVNPSGMSRKNKFAQLADHNKIMSDIKKRIRDVKF